MPGGTGVLILGVLRLSLTGAITGVELWFSVFALLLVLVGSGLVHIVFLGGSESWLPRTWSGTSATQEQVTTPTKWPSGGVMHRATPFQAVEWELDGEPVELDLGLAPLERQDSILSLVHMLDGVSQQEQHTINC